jgi:hypothetical protein
MKNKSIFSLISFFLLSMFYVAPASARGLYLNVEVPKECGAWEDVPVHDRCFTRGPSRGKAGGKIRYECVGDITSGEGRAVLDTAKCDRVVFITLTGGIGGQAWWSGAVHGLVLPLQHSDSARATSVTHNYKLCKPSQSCRSMDR